MKTVKVILSAIILSMCAISCDTPYTTLYEEEITDAVKYKISSLDYISAEMKDLEETMTNPAAATYFNSLGIDPYDMIVEEWIEMGDDVEALFLENDMTFREALASLANDDEEEYSEVCADILKRYNAIKIDLSPYKLVTDRESAKSWTFKESNSGIEFIFVMELGQYGDTWRVQPTEESIDSYLGR